MFLATKLEQSHHLNTEIAYIKWYYKWKNVLLSTHLIILWCPNKLLFLKDIQSKHHLAKLMRTAVVWCLHGTHRYQKRLRTYAVHILISIADWKSIFILMNFNPMFKKQCDWSTKNKGMHCFVPSASTWKRIDFKGEKKKKKKKIITYLINFAWSSWVLSFGVINFAIGAKIFIHLNNVPKGKVVT